MSKPIDDLLRAQTTLERVSIEDAEIYSLRELPLAQTAEVLMSQLIAGVPWRAENIVVWGKAVPSLV